MLNCQQTSQLVSQSLDRRLTWRERFALRMHLWMCKYCKRFQQQVTALRAVLARQVTHIESNTDIRLSDVAKTNITNLINRQ